MASCANALSGQSAGLLALSALLDVGGEGRGTPGLRLGLFSLVG